MAKVMVDANILVSSILFPNSFIAKIFEHITANHVLVISEYTKSETLNVFNKKFPHKVEEMKNFIAVFDKNLFSKENIDYSKYPTNRDIKDIPVLANAIEADVDILITGDKDFNDIKISKPQILTPREYAENHI